MTSYSYAHTRRREYRIIIIISGSSLIRTILTSCLNAEHIWENENKTESNISFYIIYSAKKKKKKKESNISFYMLKNAISFLIHHAR